MAAPELARETWAVPITSGLDPYSLDSTTRTRLPPMLTAAICRTLWFLKARGMLMGAKNSASQLGCGLAVQVSIPVAGVGALRVGGWSHRNGRERHGRSDLEERPMSA